MVASLAGELSATGIGQARPFRAPHHSASMAALVGGGLRARPGEVSLAHRGILFLDELPEFSRQVLDSLRQPLETGEVTVARANAHVTYPANVQLIAAMNPCRCGHAGDLGTPCPRGERCRTDYQAKISGPLLDRIDLHIEVPPVSARDLSLPPPTEGSAEVAARVAAARDAQRARLKAGQEAGQEAGKAAAAGSFLNADLSGDALERFATPDDRGSALLQEAAERLRLTARGYYRVLKVARTLADLEGTQGVGRAHVAEALSYRRPLAGALGIAA